MADVSFRTLRAQPAVGITPNVWVSNTTAPATYSSAASLHTTAASASP